MQQASVSLSVLNQLPDFIKENSPLFEKFLSYYYKSQERVAGPVGVINNLQDYFNLSKYDLDKLNASTTLISSISADSTNIEVETTNGFVEKNGTVLINDELIYYETLKKSPDVILSPGISYLEFLKKRVELFNPYLQFDGVETEFTLTLNDVPVFPPSPQHLVVYLFGEYLIPQIDYQVFNGKIIFTNAPRVFDPINLSDSVEDINIYYLQGFETNNIDRLDLIPAGSNNETIYKLKLNNAPYFPAIPTLTVVIADGNLLVPYQDYSIFEDNIILKDSPNTNVFVSYISASVTSVGSGASAYSVVDDLGRVSRILPNKNGSGYTLENVPKVSIVGSSGRYATAKALVSGLTSVTLLDGGSGYSQTNPPFVVISSPTEVGSTAAKAEVTVNSSGSIESLVLTNSGSGYTDVPRIQFVNPYGAEVGTAVVSGGGSVQSINVVSGGVGYTNPPEIYIDPPESENGIQAIARGVLNGDGQLTSITILSAGTGYNPSNPPRVKVIQPTGAQILDVGVDDFGRVISIEILDGGFGYTDTPSVYIVDDRKDNLGNYIGGTGAKAVATIFNGQIIDINITSFGTGYSKDNPPKIFISSTPGARASSEIGVGQITGFDVINSGEGYVKSQFVNCARGVSGPVSYDSENNIIFKSEEESIASTHLFGSTVTSIDSIFLSKILDRLAEQYIPGLPSLDKTTLNIANVLSTIKDFYASKGTVYSIKYLFKLLYGSDVSVTYPKDQIIKPSASTWSVDTILRCKIISGDPLNLSDALLEQIEDPVDLNVKNAVALIENYTAIQTSQYDVYELILSEETIQGKFIIPYSTKLIEKVLPESLIINVDSTIGWPERNGEIVIGTEVIRYKEKSLTQFIECTRGLNNTPIGTWDAGSTVTSNFYIYANRGTNREVVLSILGIIDANQTTLTDDGSYYLSGDKLSIAKLGSDDNSQLVRSWLYNVKKLLQVESITFGGINDQTATVTCSDPHGLLVGDQVTIYGANPIVYNGTFLVTSRESATVFKYQLPQPAALNPQGNILISIDLNTGKSDSTAINSAVSLIPSNVQNTFLNPTHVYVAASGIPNYKVGPFSGTALLPGNQRKLYKFARNPSTISLKTITEPGPVGSFVNGVTIWNYKSDNFYPFGPVTNVNIINPGTGYDASVPPTITFTGGGGTGATGTVIVNGSVVDIEILNGGTGYTSAPLVSIYGSDGIGASATAVITNGVVSKILMNSVGTGYTTEPVVTITGGGGIGAEAKAIVRGPIKEVVIDNPGTSYTSSPKVNLSSGEGAAAQAYVSNGRITSIAIIAAGSGYTTAPKVTIVGEGFGAVAKATISTEGADAGRVTSIQILNKGIGYKQGTTLIVLESIGKNAIFESEIFKWTFNLNETTNFDYANGSIFVGYNSQYGGEYGHISNPKQLRYVLGDNLDLINDQLIEKTSVTHSPILGWAFDGNPIYGPYGLSDPTLLSSSVVPIRSGYQLKSNLVYDANTNPNPSRIEGPSLTEYPAGTFIDDYVYQFNSSSVYLDQYNGRFTKTPEFPDGVYAYFVTLDSAGVGEFPYIIGPQFYSTPETWNLNQFATQSYIPPGVVRYRTPFENVDIDIERTPNETTNALTLENGELLLFEIEDENRDGLISNNETNDPDIMFEEQQLEVFDYFPKVDIASKVDIEVETTTKFEDAKVTGFLIENSGQNYQVGDRLIFDDTDTEGYGASARIAEIKGKNITSYTYEYDSTLDSFKGVVQTTEPHELLVGDTVNITTTPSMEPSSKTISVRSISGIEKVIVTQEGIGYDPELPPSIDIESNDGENASIEAVISSTGTISEFIINNSGSGFSSDPIIRVSHPQTKKKADYFYNEIYREDYKVVPQNTLVNSDKSFYVMGSRVNITNEIGGTQLPDRGYFGKYNTDGIQIYGKIISSANPSSTDAKVQIVSACKNGSKIYLVGKTYPNQSLNAAFNPDIFVCRLTENDTGSAATLNWKVEISGISGITRADNVTDIACYGDNIILTGYTNTNTTSTQDGFVILMNSSGDVITKRKVTSSSLSEKIYEIKVNSNNDIYLLGLSEDTDIIVSKLYVQSNLILVDWVKKYSITGHKFTDVSFIIDSYDDLYITSVAEIIATQNRTKVQLLRLNSEGSVVLNTQTTIGSNISITTSKCSIDPFGELSVAYSILNSNSTKTVGVLKYKYDGSIIKSTQFSDNSLTQGYTVSSCTSDASGDPIIVGTVEKNRTEFLYNAESSFNDVTGRKSAMTTSGSVTVVTDPKYGTNAYSLALGTRLQATTSITSNSWTIEGWFKFDTLSTTKALDILTITDGTDTVKLQLWSATGTNYGKVRTEVNGTSGTWSTSNNVTTLMNASYAHIALTKSFNNTITTYKIYVNGSEYTSQTSSANVDPTTIQIGSTTGSLSHPMKVDDFRLSNYVVYTGSYTIPSSGFDIVNYGTAAGSGTIDWYPARTFIFKTDKNVDSERTGNIVFTNNNITLNRSSYSVSSNTSTSITSSNYSLASEGSQILDFNYVNATSVTVNTENFDNIRDLWSSRTATVPTIGGQSVKVTSKVFDKFFFKYFNVSKVDNVKNLVLNQEFDFNIGTTLTQYSTAGSIIATAKIVDKDLENNTVVVSDKVGVFTLNTGYLASSDSYPNEITSYSFSNVNNVVLGTFEISIPGGISAEFKPYSDNDYFVRIDAITSGSPYAVGSVASITSNQVSFTTNKQQVTITGLTGVSQISLVTNLKKILKITARNNTDLIFVRTNVSHYLNENSVIYAISTPAYQSIDGTYKVLSILNKKEFIIKLSSIPSADLTTESITLFVKNPIFKFIYGQSYTFDTSHSSMLGHFLSFYRDNLYKIEYTFKNITRRGIPGVDEPGNAPFITLKITDDAANISYYADPSDLSENGPVTNDSYIDIVKSPYIGSFVISNLAGGSITEGPDKFKFVLDFEPEKVATATASSYSTTSTKAVGSISRIRLINGGGFYKKLPIISGIQSNRKIERVEIVNPGTEYEPGEYFSVPISGDGTGGKVSILVDGTTDPAGQIVEVTVTDPGKGYTTAFIDVDAVDGILGPTLAGSGAELNVIIPPAGTGASIFTRGENVGKIKKLKNNNFGFNYTHDYTLRPEITFPINLQLVNTSILSNIKVTNPGTGYTTPPEVVITGGGGTGAIAEAFIKNGRISDIIVKDPGFGYSSNPTVQLKSSFTYVVNLDLALFQFSFPHGIANGAEVQFTIQDLGEGAQFPLTSFGFIDPDQIYYAISGSLSGLEDDQLRIALTPQDAQSGNYISFANAGTGRQIILTSSFGGSAEALVTTGRFLSGEVVYQGETLQNATATGIVSTNDGWQVGPRLLKITNVEGTFILGQQVNGTVSRANGTINNINIAKGVLEVDSITKTVGKFLDDIGKPSEIVQKIQDSYLYQTFSYNVKSPISIGEWRDTLLDNTHPAGFKVFGEISLSGGGKGLTDRTDFELTKSVNLIESSVVSNIQNFALVEPIYQEFDNTQVLFRSTRLTSSEEILTSVVQRLDDISPLFDGERTTFPLTIQGETVIANTSQFLIVINGITQAAGTAFNVQQGSIVFTEPPAAPTRISYAEATLTFQQTYTFVITNVSGVLPELGNTIRGLTSNTTAIVVSSTTSSLKVFNIVGSGFQTGEIIISSLTGLNCELVSQTAITTNNLFEFKEKISNTNRKTAVIEEINLDTNTSTITNNIIISKASGTYDSPTGLLAIQLNDYIVGAKSGVVARVTGLSPYQDDTTGEFLSSITVSDPSSFFGLLFNRIVNPLNPNTIVDDISKTLIEVVDIDDDSIKVESEFIPFEDVSNIVVDFDYSIGSSTVEIGDFVQNIDINYINESGDFTSLEEVNVRKLTYHTLSGGNFIIGDKIVGLTSGETADVIGVNYALKTLYLGDKTGDFTLGEQIETTILGVTTFGNAVQSTTQKKFGSSSLYLDGTGDYISVAHNNDLEMGSDDFTIECWFYPTVTPSGVKGLYGKRVNSSTFSGNLVYFNNNLTPVLLASVNAGSGWGVNLTSSVSCNLNAWNHIAVSRSGNTWRLFVNGSLGGTSTLSGTQISNTNNFVIGATSSDGALPIQGYIDEFRVSKGVARYTATFTPSTTAFTSDVNTKLLLHFDVVKAFASNYLEVPFIAKQINGTINNIITNQIDADSRHRFRDAAKLLRLNASYIIEEAVGRMKNLYSDLIIPGDVAGSLDGTNRCKLDLSLLLDAVIKDVENGGNYESVTAARFYLDANGGLEYIRLQALQSLYAHTQMSQLCQQAVVGELSNTPLYTDKIPVPPFGVIIDPSSPECANVKSTIDSLWEQINDVIAPAGQVYRDAANQLWFNRDFIAQEATGYIESVFTYSLNGVPYSALVYPDGSPTTCERDISDYIIPSIITDLLTGGNANIISAMEFYVGNGNIQYVKNELLQTVVALEYTNTLCQYAVDNWIINGTTATEYSATYGSTSAKYKDPSIPSDNGEYGGNCERIKASIDTLFNIAIGILIPERNTYYGRYYDASNLIESNKQLIAEVAVGRMLANYPGFSVPGGNQNCIDDVVTNLEALIYDLRNGGNARTYDYSQLYTINPVLGGEQTQSIYAFNQARDMAIQAMRNETITIGGYSTLTQVKDLTVIVDPSSPTCANVASSITTLFSILTTAISNGNMSHVTRQSESDTNKLYRDAAKLILFNSNYLKNESLQRTLNNYPGFTVPGGNAKCLRDIGYIINAIVYDLLTDGNSAIVESATSYIDAATGTVLSLQGELIQSIYAYTQVKNFMKQAVAETLVSPATATGTYAYVDSNISITGSNLTEIQSFIDDEMDILLGVLNNSEYLEINSIVGSNSITVPSKTYPTRSPLTPVSGSISVGDYIYGLTSGKNAEVRQIIYNRGTVKNILKRFEIDYTESTQIFQRGDDLTRPGQPSNICIIDSIENGEFVSYIDVIITGGSFAIGNTLINDAGFTATITDITNRVQLVKTIGEFSTGDYINGLYSGFEGTIQNYEYNYAPVLSTTGGRLILETESLQGDFVVGRKVYSSITETYIDVISKDNAAIDSGSTILSYSLFKVTINYDNTNNEFPIGKIVYWNKDAAPTEYAYIVGYDVIDSTYADIYLANIAGSNFVPGNNVAYYENFTDPLPTGLGSIINVSAITSEFYARVERVSQVGNYTRLFLTDVNGTINQYAQIISDDGYQAGIISVTEVEGRISRSFLGFNGVQTEFKLTTNNGDAYFPDADGHMLVYINGILQPPGAAYTAFSDTIEFAEAPEIGASFNAVYIGKLRQLDDISFDFDSLRSSFNLRLNGVFYSLTLTSGVQSNTIRAENNIIVSLNGVIQEPGVAFQLVGSRIIFAEIPRAGSTFVAFSYIGSDADVIAAEVIPPIEPGDKLEIQSEDLERTVAIIESSNSLITFDYLGSVLGRNAAALPSIITGRISKLQLTSGGNGYTSRPTVSFDSSTGFDAQAKALVGISRVDISNPGSGYSYPTIQVDNNVP